MGTDGDNGDDGDDGEPGAPGMDVTAVPKLIRLATTPSALS